jgi:uncharacterized protein YqgV (UPF0045/DUF77 family)
VTDEFGAPLPRFRDAYVENATRQIKMNFGVDAYDHLVQGNVEEVMNLFQHAHQEIAKTLQQFVDADLPTDSTAPTTTTSSSPLERSPLERPQ